MQCFNFIPEINLQKTPGIISRYREFFVIRLFFVMFVGEELLAVA